TVYVDTAQKFQKLKMRKDESALLDIGVPASAKTLTLIATDGGDGIGSDLLFLGDARLGADVDEKNIAAADQARLAQMRTKANKLESALRALSEPPKVYAV